MSLVNTCKKKQQQSVLILHQEQKTRIYRCCFPHPPRPPPPPPPPPHTHTPKNKDGFMHSDNSSKVKILNDQFVSAYTGEDMTNLPSKGPSLHPSMEKINVQSKGVHKLLLDIKTLKATGPDSIPAFVLKAGADQLSPLLTRLYQYSLDTGRGLEERLYSSQSSSLTYLKYL